MEARAKAYALARKRACLEYRNASEGYKAKFGKHVFNSTVMHRMFPKDIYQNIMNARMGKEKIQLQYADAIAMAMKEWAISLGATHFTHWFFPLTGATAEKHDAFIDLHINDTVVEKFSGSQLIQGEPDASSFPSGGLRSTYEARGYTGWDPSTAPFIWKGGSGATLCIPSVFYSWTGDALDNKIPFLRSDAKINDAALRLLKLCNISAKQVFSTLGTEQEYFIIDHTLYSLRPDLVLLGGTVFGAPSPKGQELDDHYFAAVKDRILSYMAHLENAALELGIPLKTRHNEVAPAQHEFAPIFERAATACDHNVLLMELMRQIAKQHDLACLLFEKPFKGLNGSGKHNNWSLMTDTNINLLDPSDQPENSMMFIILMTAILHAIYQHRDLLRAGIGSFGNDKRLGGHEAPPAIISVYLGDFLEDVLNSIEDNKSLKKASKEQCDLKVKNLTAMPKDNSDRNRTSPFAFTGNKFEFRAVGSAANSAWPVTIINAIVAESLELILDEIEADLKDQETIYSKQQVAKASLPVIRKYLKLAKPIRFLGDNYSDNWKKEAKKRGLLNIRNSIEAFSNYRSKKTLAVFEDILTKRELDSRYEIMVETYQKQLEIETNLMLEMFSSHILPAAFTYQKECAASIQQSEAVTQIVTKHQREWLKRLSQTIDEAIASSEQLKQFQESVDNINKHLLKQEELKNKFRTLVDELERLVNDALWPFPKYRELLFTG